MSVEKRVSELERGDVLVNIFDRRFRVVSVKPTEFTRRSKWTGEDVPVLWVKLFDLEARVYDTHGWDADRKVRTV